WFWTTWLDGGWRVLVRAANQRHWRWRDKNLPAQEIAKRLPTRHTGRLRRGGTETVRFGITTVRLRERPRTPLSMVVVRHGKQEPLVLVT
ncbi:hypothetical protein, partial [Shigella sonnei]|uniref:hypothetical protein n=1 Tax=Shigella sonnei TaxID=624 RepID=UPI0014946E64